MKPIYTLYYTVFEDKYCITPRQDNVFRTTNINHVFSTMNVINKWRRYGGRYKCYVDQLNKEQDNEN